MSVLTQAIAKQEVKGESDTQQLSQVLADLSQTITSDSELASDTELTKNTLLAVGSVLGGNSKKEKESNEYEKMDEDTFKALA